MRILLLTLFVLLANVAQAAPRIKEVPLTAHTTLTLNIDQGGGGTRFSFPFVLDEADGDVPFTLNMTNPGFADTYSSGKLQGRNSFVVSLPLPSNGGVVPSQRANLFITVAGYEISIELHSTTNPENVFSDVVFTLTDEARETLIQKAVKQRTAVLERDYQQHRKDLAVEADNLALAKIGALAMNEPKTTRIKEEGKLAALSGEVLVYVDKAVSFGPYTIIRFEVNNRSYTDALTIQGAKLFALNSEDGNKSTKPIEGGASLPTLITPRNDGQGALTVLTSALPAAVRSLRLQVATDKGNLQVEW